MDKSYQQRKKKRNRRLLLAILMILVVGVILGTSTYAWFTANRTIKVNDVTVNVSTVTGFQVSVDAKDWKTVISNDDIINAHNTYSGAVNQLPRATDGQPGTIAPTSTIGEIDSATGFMKMFTGTIGTTDAGDYFLSAARSTETDGINGDFIAFDLFFYTNSDISVYLTSNTNVTASGSSTGIENAARMAIIKQGWADYEESESLLQGMKWGVKPGTDYPAVTDPAVIFEFNNDVHTKAGKDNALNTYGVTTTNTGATAIPYKGVKAVIPDSEQIALNSTSSTYFGDVTLTGSYPTTGIPSTAYQYLMDLDKGVTKVRVYMWIEGQDVDCENNASGGSLTYSLQVSANSSAG